MPNMPEDFGPEQLLQVLRSYQASLSSVEFAIDCMVNFETLKNMGNRPAHDEMVKVARAIDDFRESADLYIRRFEAHLRSQAINNGDLLKKGENNG